MFCPNCAGKLSLSKDNILSKDKYDIDHYSYYCGTCKAYCHLHVAGEQVTLFSTTSPTVCTAITTDLKAVLADKIKEL